MEIIGKKIIDKAMKDFSSFVQENLDHLVLLHCITVRQHNLYEQLYHRYLESKNEQETKKNRDRIHDLTFLLKRKVDHQMITIIDYGLIELVEEFDEKCSNVADFIEFESKYVEFDKFGHASIFSYSDEGHLLF